jgi:hypothetical protein
LCENIKLFRPFAASKIDFGGFDLMFRAESGFGSNAIPSVGPPLVSVLSPPLSLIKRAVSGPNATAFYPSIPNGGFD